MLTYPISACTVACVFVVALMGPPSTPALGQEPLSVIRDCRDCPEMVVIPNGAFEMGDTSGHWRVQWQPAHWVKIIYPFAVGRYEVTFAQWDACVEDGGCRAIENDEGWGRDRRPVIHVTWHDAQDYVTWLSERTGATYRLPSEAEWEYIARAGDDRFFTHGDENAYASLCRYANHGDRHTDFTSVPNALCEDGYPNATAPVGSFRPNGFGLYDVMGNVWEWVADCWSETYEGAPDDGSAWTSEDLDCTNRNMRGGSWRNRARAQSVKMRNYDSADAEYFNLGFRVVRALP